MVSGASMAKIPLSNYLSLCGEMKASLLLCLDQNLSCTTVATQTFVNFQHGLQQITTGRTFIFFFLTVEKKTAKLLLLHDQMRITGGIIIVERNEKHTVKKGEILCQGLL